MVVSKKCDRTKIKCDTVKPVRGAFGKMGQNTLFEEDPIFVYYFTLITMVF